MRNKRAMEHRIVQWLAAALFTLLVSSPAFAAISEICGDGIDNSLQTGGSAAGTKGSCPSNYHDALIGNGCDADCDSPDLDGDGYTSDGSVGAAGVTDIDCNDLDRSDYTGQAIPTYTMSVLTGYKICQSNGTYTSTVLNAVTPYCPSGKTCYYIDCSLGSDTTGDGSYNNPWASLAKVSGGAGASGLPTSPHTLVADDVVFVKNSGTCSTTLTASDGGTYNFTTDADGTSGHEWAIRWYPGATAVTSNTSGGFSYISGSYFVLDGLMGSADRGGNSNGSYIYALGAHHAEIKNIYVSGIQGQGNNNNACIYFNGTHDTNFHHNYLRDCKKTNADDPGDNNPLNLYAITWLDETGTGNGANHIGSLNTIWWQTYDSTDNGGGIRTKHGVTASETGVNGHLVTFNTILNSGQSAIQWSSAGLRAYGNRFALDAAVGATNFFTVNGVRHEDNRFQYNTLITGKSGLVWNFPYYSQPEKITFDHNIIVATSSSYSSGDNEGVISIDGYGSDAQKTYFESNNYLLSNNNCFDSPNATAVFSYFGSHSGDGGHGPAGNAGGHYSFANWGSIVGQDLASQLGSTGITGPKWKGTGGCSTYGWNNAIPTTTTSTTTTTTSTTLVLSPTGGRGRRFTSGGRL